MIKFSMVVLPLILRCRARRTAWTQGRVALGLSLRIVLTRVRAWTGGLTTGFPSLTTLKGTFTFGSGAKTLENTTMLLGWKVC